MTLLETRAAAGKAEQRVLMALTHLQLRAEAADATDKDRANREEAEAVVARARLAAAHMPRADMEAWQAARQSTMEQLVEKTAAAFAEEGDNGLQHGLARLERMEEEDQRWLIGYSLRAWTAAAVKLRGGR